MPFVWLVLALAGQAAALLLIEAGPAVRYQHYAYGPDLLSGVRPLLLGLLGVQLVAVVALGRARLPALRAWMSARRGAWRWVALGLLFAGTAAAPSRSPAQYLSETVLATAIQLLGLTTVLLFAASLVSSRGDDGGGLEARLEDGGGPSIDRLTMLAAGGVAIVTAGLGAVVYEWFPHVPDELAYLLQARYMAEGWLSVPTLPVQEAFTPEMILVRDGRWASIFPPGWPALLALGQKVGLPGLVNPVLAGLCVILTRLLVEETHDRRTARLAVVLLSVSPWFLLMAMSFMSHIASTLCALLGAWAVARARRGAPAFALVAGTAVGAVSLIRPLEGVMAGAVLGLWILWPGRRSGGPWIFRPALFGLATIAVGALNFPYNRHVTGEPLTFPIMAYSAEHYPPGANALGFGPDRGFGWPGLDPLPGHGPADVVINADLNAFAINVELFGWVCGSVLLLGLFLLFGRPRGRDIGYAAAALCVIAIQSLYWFSGGPDFGARYWYLVLVPLIVLTAAGARWLDSTTSRPGTVTRAGGALILGALLVFVPWRAVDKYHGYRGMRPGLEALVGREGLQGDLVLIRGARHPDFHAAAVLNPLVPDERATLFGREEQVPSRAELEEAFPGRRIQVLEREADGTYRVVERPWR